MPLRVKVSSSWDTLRDTLENLPLKRNNLEKMKISDLPKQVPTTSPSMPEEFSFVNDKEIPTLKEDVYPEILDEGEFDDDIEEGLDVVCYTHSKSNRPWVGRVTEVMPGQKFVINWYQRKKGNVHMFYSMKIDGQPYLSIQDNACVILWGFSEQKKENSFFISSYWLAKIRSEYEQYDKSGM